MKLTIQVCLVLACLTLATLIFWSRKNEPQVQTFASQISTKMTSLMRHSEIICTMTDKKDDIDIPSVTKPKVLLLVRFPDYYELESAVGFKKFDSCLKKCELSTNSSRYSEADVVIFYSHHGYGSFPATKKPGQIFVFFSVESPPFSQNHYYGEDKWHGLFNWTMTYRYDSEFWHGYLRTARRSAPIEPEKRVADEKEWRDVFSKKTKMVAWFVSHCGTDSRREKYVAELAKHIQVDIYGACGNLKCENNDLCMAMLRRDYKFYLSFENSICKDYVTEKLKKIYDIGGVIPIVRGGADYKNFFPESSLVDVSQFASAESLAKYLKSLAVDEDAYIKYFKWTWDYKILGPNLPLCQVCEHAYETGRMPCYYNNVYKWWSENMCFKPQDL